MTEEIQNLRVQNGHYKSKNIANSIRTKAVLKGGIWDKTNRLFVILTWIAQACFVITLATQAVTIYMSMDDKKKLFECVSIFTFCSMCFLKLCSLIFNSTRWLKILTLADRLEDDQLNTALPEAEYDSDDEESTYQFSTQIQTYTVEFRSTASTISRMYYFTLTIFVSSPFIECGYRKVMGSETGNWPHVLPGWAPLENIGFYGYLVTVTAEVIAAVYCVVIHTAFDLAVFGLMVFISTQFSMLCTYSQNVGGRGKFFYLSAKRDARTHYRIMRCHRFLLQLDDLVEELDELVRNILGIYFFVVTLTLCAVAVRLSTEALTVLEVIPLVQYTGGLLLQLFLFCYYGDMVFKKSSLGTSEGPYGAALWCISPRLRRELLLLAAGMARVRRLHAGPFNTIDLPSFIQIVRAAYSYYAVLRK